MTTTVRLVRHPEMMVPAGVCAGHPDMPLTPGGKSALPGLVLMARSFLPDSITSSNAVRCLETATTIASPLQLEPRIDPAWREIAFGTWEGRRWEDLEQEDPVMYWEWMEHFDHIAPPEGENFSMLQARVVAALEKLSGWGGRHMVVTHAGPIRAALAWVEKRPLRRAFEVAVPYSSVFDLTCTRGQWERIPYFYPGGVRTEMTMADGQ